MRKTLTTMAVVSVFALSACSYSIPAATETPTAPMTTVSATPSELPTPTPLTEAPATAPVDPTTPAPVPPSSQPADPSKPVPPTATEARSKPQPPASKPSTKAPAKPAQPPVSRPSTKPRPSKPPVTTKPKPPATKNKATVRVTGCQVVKLADGRFSTTTQAYVSDPDRVGYTVTLTAAGKSRTFSANSGSQPFSYGLLAPYSGTCSASIRSN